MNNPRPYRSLFWPVLLIGLGVIFLLSNLDIIKPVNANALFALWPLILIVIGLDLIFARRSPLAGALIALVVIGAIVAVLIAAPSLNLPSGGQLQTRSLTDPVGAATSAEINLAFSSQPVSVHPVNDPANLFEGQIQYYGNLHYSSNGNPVRRISLSHSSVGFNFGFDLSATPRWEIGLNPTVPINLQLNGSSGSLQLDLASLNLSGFSLDQGSGSADVNLALSRQPYTADFSGGSGSLNLNLPAGADLTLHMNRGSGSTNINLPAGAAVRLEVRNSGSGSVNFPSNMTLISGGGNNKEGVWQTAGYDNATHKINIICDDLGSGSFNLD